MDDTVDHNLPHPDSHATDPASEQDINTVRSENHQLKRENEQLQAKLEEAETELNHLRQRLDRIQRENEQLSDQPLFVATVIDILDDQKVVIRQHGNNQEAVTEVTAEFAEEIEIQDRVAVNNSLGIVDTLDNQIEADVEMMEVTKRPDINYADIGGLENEIQEVRETIEKPITEPETFKDIGIDPPSGVLLHGPPGTGKTMIAKAAANESDATFIQLAGSDLARKFIGEGARLVRDLFSLAKEREPCVIFIDEIDAIAAERTESKSDGDAEVQRTLIQLLNEMDGFSSGDRNISIIGATNRVDMLDEALLRPGRFDRKIEIPTPDITGQQEIFAIHLDELNTASDVSPAKLTSMTPELTGAEIKNLCTEAGMEAIRDDRTEVTLQDVRSAHARCLQSKSTDDSSATKPIAFA